MNCCLERLDLPYVDIVYAYRPDRQTPMEENVCVFNYLVYTDKGFYWGSSEWSDSEIADAWRFADKLGYILHSTLIHSHFLRKVVKSDSAPLLVSLGVR